MKAMFLVGKSIGDGQTLDTAFRVWCNEAPGLRGFYGHYTPGYGHFAGNAFADDQAILDVIASDGQTEFSFPIDVNGTELAYDDVFEIPPFTRGKIIAWCAKTYGAEFGQAVAANAKNRRFVAGMVLRQASGVPNADPLNGWRIHWTS